jgi:hypothetical protein
VRKKLERDPNWPPLWARIEGKEDKKPMGGSRDFNGSYFFTIIAARFVPNGRGKRGSLRSRARSIERASSLSETTSKLQSLP